MPNWINDLPDEMTRPGFRLLRTPPDRPLRAVATAAQLQICWTHWWTGRTRPCEKPDCEACQAGAPARAHVYVSAVDISTHEHFIFECTAKAAGPFAEWLDNYPSLRGCHFVAYRPKRRRNAPVEIHCRPIDLNTIQLPPPPDVTKIMAIVWHIPTSALDLDDPENPHPEIRTNRDVVDRMRFNPADAIDTRQLNPGNGRPD